MVACLSLFSLSFFDPCMQQDHYPKVAAAIQYLSEHAIPGITILGHHHSDHCYGQIHHSARQDRINVRFQYYGKIVDGKARSILDTTTPFKQAETVVV